MKVYRMSELEKYMTCGRAYYHQYVENLEEKKFGGVARDFGGAVHAGMEVLYGSGDKAAAVHAALAKYDEGWKKSGKDLTAEDLEKIADSRAAVEAVMKAVPWGKEDFESVQSIEDEIVVDMGRERGLKVRLDLVVKTPSGSWLHDTKTTGVELGAISKIHRVRKQYIGYQLALESKGIHIVGTMMDFILKPRTYRRKDGTTTVGEPKFLREPVHHSAEEVAAFKGWFHSIVDQIEDDHNMMNWPEEEWQSWRQNTASCFLYMRECEFLPLCSVSALSAERLKPVLYQVKEPEGLQAGVEVD